MAFISPPPSLSEGFPVGLHESAKSAPPPPPPWPVILVAFYVEFHFVSIFGLSPCQTGENWQTTTSLRSDLPPSASAFFTQPHPRPSLFYFPPLSKTNAEWRSAVVFPVPLPVEHATQVPRTLAHCPRLRLQPKSVKIFFFRCLSFSKNAMPVV